MNKSKHILVLCLLILSIATLAFPEQYKYIRDITLGSACGLMFQALRSWNLARFRDFQSLPPLRTFVVRGQYHKKLKNYLIIEMDGKLIPVIHPGDNSSTKIDHAYRRTEAGYIESAI